MRFSRQEYWNGLPFPSPGYLPNPGIEYGSPACIYLFLQCNTSAMIYLKQLIWYYWAQSWEEMATVCSGLLPANSSTPLCSLKSEPNNSFRFVFSHTFLPSAFLLLSPSFVLLTSSLSRVGSFLLQKSPWTCSDYVNALSQCMVWKLHMGHHMTKFFGLLLNIQVYICGQITGDIMGNCLPFIQNISSYNRLVNSSTI